MLFSTLLYPQNIYITLIQHLEQNPNRQLNENTSI